MNRKPLWRTALYNYFDEVRRTPFDKDNNNCAQFIANGWLVVRDDDPFAQYRQHGTFEALLRAIKRDGFENHMDFFKTFMVPYDHPSQARVGDIAVFEVDDEIGYASGWVIGTHVFVLRQDGIGSYPLANAIKAFAV